MRDVSALQGLESGASATTTSISSDPTIVMARCSMPEPTANAFGAPVVTPFATTVPLARSMPPRRAESETPAAVATTQGTRRSSRGIPLPALALGWASMAAVIALVVVFVSGADESRSRTAAATPAQTAATDTTEAPSAGASSGPSFIEIEAPDVPSAASAPKKKAAVVASKPAAKDAGSAASSEAVSAEGTAYGSGAQASARGDSHPAAALKGTDAPGKPDDTAPLAP